MGGPKDDDDDTPKTEPNLYRNTLADCKNTLIPDCKDRISTSPGNPAQGIATSIQNGGWECPEADTWVTELLEHSKGIMGAFDDAQSHVQAKWNSEPDRVPEHDWRGYNWPRNWRNQRRL